jgi:hypothetical protein
MLDDTSPSGSQAALDAVEGPDAATPTGLRLQLQAAGFSPLPLRGKAPPMEGWQNKFNTSRDEIVLWEKMWPDCENTGVLTRLTPAVDIDILHPDAADAIEALAREHFEEHGNILVRFGQRPKRAILLRTNPDEAFGKLSRIFFAPDGSEQKIEILATGQQVVVAGIHPKTGHPYSWHGGEPWLHRREDLPYARECDMRAFLDEAAKRLVEFGFKDKGGSKRKSNTNGGDQGPDGKDQHNERADWGILISRILAGESLHDSLVSLAASFVGSGLTDTAAIERLRQLMTACKAEKDDRWRKRYDEIPSDVHSARNKFKRVPDDTEAPHERDKDAEPALIPLHEIFPIYESAVPPRAWIVPGFLMRRHLTVLVAPTGSGKSLLTIQIGLACAVNMEWAGWRPRRKFRVMFINSEDDLNEMRRRHFAAATIMNLDHHALRKQVLVVDETMDGIVIAKYDAKRRSLLRTPLLEGLVATITAAQIDIVFVDPFAETFDGDENSNNELKWAAVLWREVARRTNTAVGLVHHTKKYAAGMAGDVDAARGAGALAGVARIVSTVFTMTKEEAQAMGVPEEDRVRYIVMTTRRPTLT